MYILIYIYRALRARSDWVQSTDARISYASAPPLTNCHRSPNSMMFLDSGIKLAIPRQYLEYLKRAVRGF